MVCQSKMRFDGPDLLKARHAACSQLYNAGSALICCFHITSIDTLQTLY